MRAIEEKKKHQVFTVDDKESQELEQALDKLLKEDFAKPSFVLIQCYTKF